MPRRAQRTSGYRSWSQDHTPAGNRTSDSRFSTWVVSRILVVPAPDRQRIACRDVF
jgi:hypothetical protein